MQPVYITSIKYYIANLIFIYAAGEIQKKQAYLIYWDCIGYWYPNRVYFK